MVLNIHDQIKARMEETEGVTLIKSLDPLLGAEIWAKFQMWHSLSEDVALSPKERISQNHSKYIL